MKHLLGTPPFCFNRKNVIAPFTLCSGLARQFLTLGTDSYMRDNVREILPPNIRWSGQAMVLAQQRSSSSPCILAHEIKLSSKALLKCPSLRVMGSPLLSHEISNTKGTLLTNCILQIIPWFSLSF